MLGLLKRFFIWWHDSTYGTALFTWRKGQKVGEDVQGNVYYSEKNGTRRWVIYKGDIDASRVPPEWHGWLHYTVDVPPSVEAPAIKPWEKEHEPNKTGTVDAYMPKGSLQMGGDRAAATGDYEAWRP